MNPGSISHLQETSKAVLGVAAGIEMAFLLDAV